MKYIQSFYQYPVTFSAIGKTIPAKSAEGELRNIAEMSDEDIETLKAKEPLFNSLIERKKIRILNKLPESYKPAAAQINEARAEADGLKTENEAQKKEIEELKKRLETLEKKASKPETVKAPKKAPKE